VIDWAPLASRFVLGDSGGLLGVLNRHGTSQNLEVFTTAMSCVF